MRTRATLAVRLVTRVTRVTRVDIPKTLYVSDWFKDMHADIYFKALELYFTKNCFK